MWPDVQSVSNNNDKHQVAQSQSDRTEHSVTLETFMMELSQTASQTGTLCQCCWSQVLALRPTCMVDSQYWTVESHTVSRTHRLAALGRPGPLTPSL